MTHCRTILPLLAFASAAGACVEARGAERAEQPGAVADAATAGEHSEQDSIDAEAPEPDAPPLDAGLPASSDAAAFMETASDEAGAAPVDAGVDAAAPPLPRVSVTRRGALGFCIDPGTFWNAAIESTSEGGAQLSGDLVGPCDSSACPSKKPAPPRELAAGEVAHLRSLLAALPDGECEVAPSPLCDPCLVQDLTIGDRSFYVDGCAPFCPGFAAPIGRLLTFLDDLAVANPRADSADCYSPTQNLDRSYETGARGCACDWQPQSVCAAGTALICQRSPGDVARWQAVPDGPCWQPADCAPEQAVATLEACLDEAVLCVGPREGEFCAF